MKNLPAECAEILGHGGLQADTVADEGLVGADDSALAAASRSEGRILVTLDLDFANIPAYPPAEYAGIIVLHPRGRTNGPSSVLCAGSPWSW